MIKRSLIVCVLAVLAWHLARPRLPGYFSVPGQQRANHLHAQQFVHDAPKDAPVIVGSSMADRLDAAKLGGGIVKLTFPGGGPLTGLELVRGAGRTPPVLWIETNVLLRDTERDLVDGTLAPWRRALRETSPVFREEGRPSEFGVGILKAVIRKLDRKPAAATQALDPKVFDDIMKENRAHLDRRPDPRILAERVRRLGEIVDHLTQAGTRCVFFEMPIDASLTRLAEPAAIREALRERFPATRYPWLDLSRDTPWQTTDGVHLKPGEIDQVIERMKAFQFDAGK